LKALLEHVLEETMMKTSKYY